jgi:cysteine rich repeat protein
MRGAGRTPVAHVAGLARLAGRWLPVWAGLFVVALAAVPLAAQQPTSAQQNAIRQNCRSDFQAHCSGVPAGGSAAMGCLRENAAIVSVPCQKALSAIGASSGTASSGGQSPSGQAAPPPLSPRQRAHMLHQACRTDFQNDCHGVQPGGGRAVECLMAHSDTLSAGCQKALASMRH